MKNKINKRMKINYKEDNMTQKKSLILVLIFLITYSCGEKRIDTPANYIQAVEAHNYVGDVKTVCGKVVESRFESSTFGHTTYFNIDRIHPNQILTIVILGNDRINFDPNPEDYYLYESICVTGLIQSHEGVAQIEINSPKQIRIARN